MAQLNASERNRMASKSFAIPGKRAYPIPDMAHARNALARVAQHGTPAQMARVRAAVYKKFPGLKKRKKERGG